jgi:hypothetical protein
MGSPWFRRRQVGFGWRPIRWQGWLVTVLAVALAVGALTMLHGSTARVPIVILIIAVYATVALATGGAERVAAAPEDQPSDDEAEIAMGGVEQRLALRALTSERVSPSSPDKPALVVEHLTKRFGERVAVDDVSFSVAAGEVFGFLGSNAAGIDGGSLRELHHRNERSDIAAAAVDRGDLLICLEPLASGNTELLRERLSGRADRCERGDRHGKPEADDESFVPESLAGECGHGLPSFR